MAWKRLDDWVGTNIDDHLVMIHLESGQYVSLNETAAETWEALDTPKEQDAIVARLTDKFDIDAESCERAVAPLLTEMRDLGLIVEVA